MSSQENEELIKICPIDERFRDYQPDVKTLALPWINMNAGLVVLCKHGWLLGECPMGCKHICHFSLNPEKKYAVSDPRFWIGRDVTVNDT